MKARHLLFSIPALPYCGAATLYVCVVLNVIVLHSILVSDFTPP